MGRYLDSVATAGQKVCAILVLLLGARASWDVLRAESFPPWFPPLFAVATATLAGLTAWAAFGAPRSASPPGRALRGATWALLAVSIVFTTSLHSFYPFRADVVMAWETLPGLRLNFILAAGAVGLFAVLFALDLAGRRALAVAILPTAAPLLLAPNDDCANPFNTWWLREVGMSPLMYLPTVIGIVFAVSVFRGDRPRLWLALLAGAGVGVLLLGLGHRTRLIW